MPDEYISFVVRFWRDPPATEPYAPWQGEVEQIQSGVRWSFRTLPDLIAFLSQVADRPCLLICRQSDKQGGE